MAESLTLNNKTFEYPSNGESPGYGEEATAWAKEANTVLNTLFGNNDISITTATILDNQTTAANVTGLIFDASFVRSFEVIYDVIRNDGSSQIQQNGKILGIYDGSDWSITSECNGDAGIDFIINNDGQIQYFSTSVGGTYTGTMKFKASTLDI
jgi:hypothetical protein